MLDTYIHTYIDRGGHHSVSIGHAQARPNKKKTTSNMCFSTSPIFLQPFAKTNYHHYSTFHLSLALFPASTVNSSDLRFSCLTKSYLFVLFFGILNPLITNDAFCRHPTLTQLPGEFPIEDRFFWRSQKKWGGWGWMVGPPRSGGMAAVV